MNRLISLKNFAKYVGKSNFRLQCNHLNFLSFRHLNLLHRNEFFLSTFSHQEKQFADKSTANHNKRSQVKENDKMKSQKNHESQDLSYSEELKKLTTQFLQQTAYFAAPLQHSKTYHYASYFLPTVRMLHAKDLIHDKNFLKNIFRDVKNTIKPTKYKKFNPQSVVRLIEQFSMIDFDGDESISLDTMLDYVQKNVLDFTQNELQKFQAAYKQIMVEKAMGPVRFKPFIIEKTYKSQAERSAALIKQSLQQFFCHQDQNVDKEISLEYNLDKKWIIIKVPSKKLTIFTYPKSLAFTEEEAYSYIYDLKQIINSIVSKTMRQKNKLSREKFKIDITLRQYLPSKVVSKYQHISQKGLVYKQKKIIVDELQKYEEMKKMSLKEQILKMKEKKKELKKREKLKEKQKNVENPIKLQNPNKIFDFFETIKFSIDQIQKQILEKLNKTKIRNQIPKTKKKKKKAARLEQEIQQDEEMKNQDEQINQEDEKQDDISHEEKMKMNPEIVEKMRADLQVFHKKVAQKQQKVHQAKKQKPQLPIIESFMQLKQEQITINKIFFKTLAESSLQQIKQFSAYTEMISSFKNALKEIDKAQRIKNFMKRVEQNKRNENEKDEISEERFRMIRDEMNEPLDTKIQLNMYLEEIFVDRLKYLKSENTKVGIKKDEIIENLSHEIVIMSEEELLNSIKATKRREIMNETTQKVLVKEQDSTIIEQKEKIFKKSFLQNQFAQKN